MCMNVTRCDSVSSGVGTTPTQPGTMHVDSACNVCESLCPMLRCDVWSWNHPNRTKHSCEVIGVTPWACIVPNMLYMCSCFFFSPQTVLPLVHIHVDCNATLAAQKFWPVQQKRISMSIVQPQPHGRHSILS